MDTSTVLKKIKSKEYSIKSVKLRSKVWDTFGSVCDSAGKELEFVACHKCQHVLSYRKGKTGTSTMANHRCNPHHIPNQPTLLVKKTPATPSQPLSSQTKAKIKGACVGMVTEDLRPFDTVAGEGFLDLVDTVST